MNLQEEIKQNFPEEIPRPGQLEIVDLVMQSFNEGYKYVMLDAGTGTGKSAIGYTIASLFYDSYILTNTKALQDQYIKYNVTTMKGRNAYDCRHMARDYEYQLGKQSNKSILSCAEGYCKRIPASRNFQCPYNATLQSTFKDYELADENESFKVITRPIAYETADDKIWYYKDPDDPTLCHYLESKRDSLNSRMCCANYDFLITDNKFLHHFPERDVMICDEAHNIEKKLIGYNSLFLNPKSISKKFGVNINIPSNIDDMESWIIEILTVKNAVDIEINNLKKSNLQEVTKPLIDKMEDLNLEKSEINLLPKEDRDTKRLDDIEILLTNFELKIHEYEDIYSAEYLQELKRQSDKLRTTAEKIEENNNNWAVIENKEYIPRLHKKVVKSYEFKPVKVDIYTEDDLLSKADQILFMSATIPSKEIFCDTLGLNPEEVCMIHAEEYIPRFNPENNPAIFLKSKQCNTGNNPEAIGKQLAKIVQEILDQHPNEKGLIHTQTWRLNNTLFKNLADTSRIITHTSDNRNSQEAKFKNSWFDSKVFMSPSAQEGIDLPDDMCRFQIICKVPYYIFDAAAQKRTKTNAGKEWYQYQAIVSMLQMHGRGVRNPEDYCTTYIIDSRFDYFYRKNRNIIPEYFKKSVRVGKIEGK